MKKIVYCGLAADILHEGHINLLKFASKYGQGYRRFIYWIDKAIAGYKISSS